MTNESTSVVTATGSGDAPAEVTSVDVVVSWRSWMVATGVGLGLSLIFWWPLFTGGGLVGGDIYTYFFPQKAYLSEHLSAGELPLWNNRVGHGYPVVGES